MITALSAAHLSIRALPARRPQPPSVATLRYQPVELASVAGPLRLAGAWNIEAADPRFGGISSLTLDEGRFLAVSDRGAVARFDSPRASSPRAWLADLRDGPGPLGRKWSRDAESLAPDPGGRGWWVGYEQNHSLWLYDRGFTRSLASVDLHRPDWRSNRGAEGLLAEAGGLLVAGENGREAMRTGRGHLQRLALRAGADVAEAAAAPDGSRWLLLRSKGWHGISQSIAPLVQEGPALRTGPSMPLPKGAFDNYEGMAIEPRGTGGLRFWLITDDGHRIMARTLLVALDYLPVEHDESPAQGTGLSNKRAVKTP